MVVFLAGPEDGTAPSLMLVAVSDWFTVVATSA